MHHLIPSHLVFLPYDARLFHIRLWFSSLPPLSFMMREAFSYFSIWSIVSLLSLCIYELVVNTSAPFSLVFLVFANTWLCSVGGFYITYISPRALCVYYLAVHVDTWVLQLMDLFSHHMITALMFSCFRHSLFRHDVSVCHYLLVYLEVFIYLLYIGRHDTSTLLKSVYRRYGLDMYDMILIAFFTQMSLMSFFHLRTFGIL
jgi:hypothetical protein